MALEAMLVKEHGTIDFTAAAALVAGQVMPAVGGRVGVVAGLKGFASGDKATAAVEGQFNIASASATVFASGDPVYWDDTANQATTVSAGNTLMGKASKAKVSGDLVVLVDLNK